MDETRLYDLIGRAKDPSDIDAKYEILIFRDRYSKNLTLYTLRSIYLFFYEQIDQLLIANPTLQANVIKEKSEFKSKPGLKTLHSYISAITEYCRRKSPQAFFAIADKISLIIKNLVRALPDILSEKFPDIYIEGSKGAKEIIQSVPDSNNAEFTQIAKFIKIISKNGPELKFDRLFDDLLVKCLAGNKKDIIASFFNTYNYEFYDVEAVKSLNGVDEITYICLKVNSGHFLSSPQLTIPLGRKYGLYDKYKLQYPIQTPFFVSDEDIDNLGIFIPLESNVTQCVKLVNGYINSLSVAFGRDNVELEVEDKGNSGLAWELEACFPKQRASFNKSESEVMSSLEALKDCIDKRIDKYGNYMALSRQSDKPICNLIIAVIYNPHEFNSSQDKLYREVLKKGYRAGVIVLTVLPFRDYYARLQINPRSMRFDLEDKFVLTNPFDIVRPSDIDITSSNWYSGWIRGAKKIKNKWRDGIKLEEPTVEEPVIALDDFESNFTEIKDAKMSFPIGELDDNNFYFTLDTVEHSHAFVIGKTGSGKSVLLHNMIMGLINRFSPAELELHLLDFKLGGVEFNRYKNIKHIRTLLVDNSDFQIVTEIMRDIDARMKSRGKILSNSNAKDIVEYNKKHPEKPMPQIVVIIDECHQIFNSNDRANIKKQDEVSGILIKIAKEGRSQGVHLIFATQTLSGTDIPNDILNNITDYYLLNCNPSDSERLVNGSSQKTSNLGVGLVYYHHQSSNQFFRGAYLSGDKANEYLNLIRLKSQDFGSNGEFYFNGSQRYYIDEEYTGSQYKTDNLSIVAGKSVDLKHSDIKIDLPNVEGENILINGLNIGNNNLRVIIGLLLSRLIFEKDNAQKTRIIVLNCLRQEDDLIKILKTLCDNNYIEYAEVNKIDYLAELSNQIINQEVVRPTLLFILGQEKMKELNYNYELPKSELQSDADAEDTTESVEDLFSGIGDLGITDTSAVKKPKTVMEAMHLILNSGPIEGIHTIMQIDKIERWPLYEDLGRKRDLYRMFKHLILLKSNENATNYLDLSDEITPERLTEDDERLRAVYYNEEIDSYSLFTPFSIPDYDSILKVI